MVVGLEEISYVDVKYDKVTGARNIGHGRSTKYRSRSPDQGTCKVRTLRRSTMQGLVVVGLIVEAISNINVKYIKVTAVLYIGQGHRVKNPAESVH